MSSEIKINVLGHFCLFGSFDPFSFHVNFRISLSISAKELVGFFDRDYTETVDQFDINFESSNL